jgi:hypothetical protein
MHTYNVGVFVTSKSPKHLKAFVKRLWKNAGIHSGKEQLGYHRDFTRKEVVELVKKYPTEKHVIYCPAKDKYIDAYFRDIFLNLDDPFGKLMYDEGLHMLGYDGDILRFQGGVGLNENTGEILRGLPLVV